MRVEWAKNPGAAEDPHAQVTAHKTHVANNQAPSKGKSDY